MTRTATPLPSTDHLSTLALHRLRYGELTGATLVRAQDHLAACAACAERLQVQEQGRAAFVLRPVPDALRDLREPEDLGSRWWTRLLHELRPLAFAAAAALVVVVAVPRVQPAQLPAEPEAPWIGTRGTLPAVEAWVDLGRGPRPLEAGEALGAGTRVQLAYDPQGASYVAVAGRDGSGRIEVYATDAPTGVGLVRAPFALTLDDAPGVQELFVVGADRPLDDRAVKAAVAQSVPGQPSSTPGVRVARLAIRKE